MRNPQPNLIDWLPTNLQAYISVCNAIDDWYYNVTKKTRQVVIDLELKARHGSVTTREEHQAAHRAHSRVTDWAWPVMKHRYDQAAINFEE